MEAIKSFGNIYYDSNFFKFKQFPKNAKEDLKYEVSGEKNNIVTKTGPDGYLCVICENELKKNNIYKWKIKILKTRQYDIKIGQIDLASEKSGLF